MQRFEVIIVGAGPAGCATALELTNLNPALASRVLLLDKAVFPRFKLCGGGVTIDADIALKQLGVNVDVPANAIHLSTFVLPGGYLTLEQPNHFRVVRRDQFDEVLFREASKRGVIAQDGESVEAIIETSKEIIIRTSKNEYRSKILIGADGANSTVRQAMGLKRDARLMIALETFVPLNRTSISGFSSNTAIFDVSIASRGVPGYCWVFPTVSDDPTVSLGMLAAPFLRDHALPLRNIFNTWVNGQGVNSDQFELASHPVLRYEPRASSSKPRILLVGDAAGIDPLFGEGISSALALGMVAARSAVEALEENDFEFKGYERRIRASSIGAMMRRRRLLAKRLYSNPRLASQYLQHGALLRWIALLKLSTTSEKLSTSGKLTWKAT